MFYLFVDASSIGGGVIDVVQDSIAGTTGVAESSSSICNLEQLIIRSVEYNERLLVCYFTEDEYNQGIHCHIKPIDDDYDRIIIGMAPAASAKFTLQVRESGVDNIIDSIDNVHFILFKKWTMIHYPTHCRIVELI